MRKVMFAILICLIGTTVFARPPDRGGRGHRPPPPKHHHHGHNDGLYIANGILGIVDKSLRILTPPRVIYSVPQVVTPVPQKETIIINNTVPATKSEIIQVGTSQYLIQTDENGNKEAILIKK